MFNKYPYTDFHELNLDWILEKVKTFDAQLSELVTDFSQIESDFQTVQTQVNNLLNTMEAQIRQAINDYVPGYVDSQLAPYMNEMQCVVQLNFEAPGPPAWPKFSDLGNDFPALYLGLLGWKIGVTVSVGCQEN